MDQTFTSAPHHDVLVLIIQVAVLLLVARTLGELSQRLGQPSVVGEILAGVLLGPSFLSGISPLVEEWMIPQTPLQGYLLEVVGLLGVMHLMILTGLETDVALIRRQSRSAIGVAAGGLILPLVIGFALGMGLPDKLVANPDERFVFALFVATAMSISAIPVVAKVLMDLNLTRRDVGQIIIASAMIDDTVGWILLSVVIGLAGGAEITFISVGEAVFKVLGFLIFSFTIGRMLVRFLLTFTQRYVMSREKNLSLVIILAFVWGGISQALELEAMLGGFLVGILFSQMADLDSEVVHKLESVALGIFAPIFFAIAGLKVNILNLLEPALFLDLMLVIAVASLCKILGVYLGARWIAKRDHWSAIFFGAGLNARGSMEIIIATVGLSLGILTQDMFSIIVVMAVTTSLMAPFLLRWALPRIPIDPQEAERLHREELNKVNFLSHVHRVLLPVRIRDLNENQNAIQVIQARVLELLDEELNLTTTLATATKRGEEEAAYVFLNQTVINLPARKVIRKVLVDNHASDAILDEVKRGYDLMLLGVSEGQSMGNTLFSPIIDKLVRLAHCPTLLVHSLQLHLEPTWSPKRLLVPVTGSESSRNAVQLAFAMASSSDIEVILLKVVSRRSRNTGLPLNSSEQRELHIARQIVDECGEMGHLFNVQAVPLVELGQEPEQSILEVARKRDCDLIVLGTNVRPASEQLYFGSRVERILHNAPCPIIIINAG